MQWARNIADRLGISVWVVWVGVAALVVALVLLYRRFQAARSGTGTNAGTSGQNDVLNGPFSGGIDGTTANPNPTSPDGGADQGTTPAPPVPTSTGSTPPASTSGSGGSSGGSKVFVHPSPWPAPTSTLSGIAKNYGVSLASVEAFPENQYIRSRSPRGFDLIYTSDSIRIK